MFAPHLPDSVFGRAFRDFHSHGHLPPHPSSVDLFLYIYSIVKLQIQPPINPSPRALLIDSNQSHQSWSKPVSVLLFIQC